MTARFGTHVVGDGDHAGDAEADLRLLLRRKHLTQRRIGERLCLTGTTCGVQPDRRLGDERTAQGMLTRRELERAPAQVGGGHRIGWAQCLGGLQQGGDGKLVSGLSARGELRRHLDGQRSARHQHGRRLAIEGAAHRRRQTRPHRLECEVVIEGELLVAFDKQAIVDQLLDRPQQSRR